MTKQRHRRYPGRIVNDELSAHLRREVVKLEALPIEPGQSVRVVVEGTNSLWRQGVRVATEGMMRSIAVAAPQLDIWPDTAPPVAEIVCDSTDGLVRIYNIWHSGRHPGIESLMDFSGMVLEVREDGWRQYSCTDTGWPPDFTKIVFRVLVT